MSGVSIAATMMHLSSNSGASCKYLTVIKDNENYDEVINRTVCLSPREDYDRRLLEHLRSRRNASVHRGESYSRAETLIFQLKWYVEYLMLFHLQHGWRHASAEEVGQLLSKGRDTELLKRRIAELKAELSLNKAC